jgi:NAD(P)-dependent dehydrogenase (short-subunit alcohol dehydrogenase family)
MNKPIILVTGATGKTGAAVVAQLLEKGWPVRAIVRTLDARSKRLRREGADVVVADLFHSDLGSIQFGSSRNKDIRYWLTPNLPSIPKHGIKNMGYPMERVRQQVQP